MNIGEDDLEESEEDREEIEAAEARFAFEKRKAERIVRQKDEEAQGRLTTLKRKAKKVARIKLFRAVSEEYASGKITGNIEWLPKHSASKERWNGVLDGKKTFIIERGFFKYSLKILNEELIPMNSDGKRVKSKVITERDFEAVAKKAENIVENYLKALKKKKNEVSKNKSTGR